MAVSGLTLPCCLPLEVCCDTRYFSFYISLGTAFFFLCPCRHLFYFYCPTGSVCVCTRAPHLHDVCTVCICTRLMRCAMYMMCIHVRFPAGAPPHDHDGPRALARALYCAFFRLCS